MVTFILILLITVLVGLEVGNILGRSFFFLAWLIQIAMGIGLFGLAVVVVIQLIQPHVTLHQLYSASVFFSLFLGIFIGNIKNTDLPKFS